MEQRTVNTFCVKLKKGLLKRLKSLKSAYGEECLSRVSAFEFA
jgi:hypothetical protein